MTYDTNESDQIQIGDLPVIKKTVIRSDGDTEDNENEDDEDEEEEKEEVEEVEVEEEEVEEEEEEYDSEGNVLPRSPVLYDSSEEEDFMDGRRMKTHLRKHKTSESHIF